VVCAIVLVCSLETQAQAPAIGVTSGRALPLNRFEVSRETQTDPSGYFRMATAIGDDYFDGRDTRERVRRHMRVARDVGVRYLRCAFSWNGIEPEEGKFQFAFWDMLVEEAEKAGIKLIPYVAYTPEWAARSPEQFWQQPPRDSAMFATVMKALAARYRGRIASWELWNEPDLKEYWQGTVDEFAELVKVGAAGVRDGDPKAVTVLGGMSHGPAEFFDTLMTRHHIYRWVDVIAMHGYPESWDEDRAEAVYGARVAKMENEIRRSGSQLDLWLNEMGYADYRFQAAHASEWGTNAYYDYEHTKKYAAEFLLKSMLMTAASGDVSLAGWYRIDDFRHSDRRMPADKVHYHLGLVDVNGRPKPEYYAMKFANRLLDQKLRPADSSTTVKRAPQSQAIVHAFETPEGKVIVTGWLRSSEYKEVNRHTGMEKDRRHEQVDVTLPCRAKEWTTFSATGRKLGFLKAQSRAMYDVPLSGNRVFVAIAQCATH
jgi:polysaccharide biosynthesis protein PslG